MTDGEQEPEPIEPEEEKKDRRSETSGSNFKEPGPGIPPGTELPTKRTYPPEKLIKATADALMAGKPGSIKMPNVGPVTDADRKMILRVSGLTVEEFQAGMTKELQEIGMLAAQSVKQKLIDDTFRPDTIPAVLAISIDKLAMMNGRTPMAGSVHVQINNFGAAATAGRNVLLDNLKGLRGEKRVEPTDLDIGGALPA